MQNAVEMVVLLLRVVLASAISATVCLHHPAQGTVPAVDIFEPFAFSVLDLVWMLFEVWWFAVCLFVVYFSLFFFF